MSKIDWKEIAKEHYMDYHEFGEELINTTIAYMSLEMEITKDNIKLLCTAFDSPNIISTIITIITIINNNNNRKKPKQ